MLIEGNSGDAVWMVIDMDVIPGRLVNIVPADDAPDRLRVNVRYSDRDVVRSNFTQYVFHNNAWDAARDFANDFARSLVSHKSADRRSTLLKGVKSC